METTGKNNEEKQFMRTPIKIGALMLLAAVTALSIIGCDILNPTAPETAPPPVPPVRPAPTPPPSPDPAPPPQEPVPVLLEFGEYYYMFGDPDYMSIIFHEDGAVIRSTGEEAQFEIDGASISIFAEGEWESELRIIDEFTLEDPLTGISFIREGGEGFGGITDLPAGPRLFFAGEYYFLDGNEGEAGLIFRDENEAGLYGEEEPEYGTYAIAGNELTVTIGGEIRFVLSILDPTTLEDKQTGEKYGLAGAFDRELKLYASYYQFGDKEDLSLFFRDDDEVDFEFPGFNASTGIYEVDPEEYAITMDVDGVEMELSIINYYLLRILGEDIYFVRVP